MHTLIKRFPYAFGIILLLGIVSVVYLLLFGLGLGAQTWGVVNHPSAFAPGVSTSYTLVIMPVIGFFFGLFICLFLAVLFLLLSMVRDLLKGANVAIKGLGNWLVKQTQSPRKSR